MVGTRNIEKRALWWKSRRIQLRHSNVGSGYHAETERGRQRSNWSIFKNHLRVTSVDGQCIIGKLPTQCVESFPQMLGQRPQKKTLFSRNLRPKLKKNKHTQPQTHFGNFFWHEVHKKLIHSPKYFPHHHPPTHNAVRALNILKNISFRNLWMRNTFMTPWTPLIFW